MADFTQPYVESGLVVVAPMVRQFRQYSSLELASSGRSSTCTRLQTFLSFADEKEQEKQATGNGL
ncbi:hypothetical protein NC652_019022 [Populus alba x Populus x berolinensis]|uniref:Uncharacterized protein n=1 Tax=Populus alba x Populus x berolinensis TaxID=444605 RepID=A0AAD6QHF5_9ROSI|nr:hypothetical protein NC652_019022 [Populus alba x Populus x berolinensis]KAJ6990449.1 hypothetical protein NC653_018870 [Populus alba x Populus x berolinensis]